MKYENMLKEWGLKYLEIYQRKEGTPFIHVMICHVGEFIFMGACIISFTQQGLNKI